MRPVAYRLTGLLLALSCSHVLAQTAPVQVPLGGNAYITTTSPAADELIDDNGLHNWDSRQAVISTFFDVQQAGQLNLSLVGSLSGASHSTVKVTVGRQSHLVHLSNTGTSPFAAGNFTIDKPGYVRVDLQGVSTDGGYFGDIADLQASGSATQAGTVFANDPSNFYWSLRGPSVHLGFQVPANTEYFYSEVTVPRGQDPVGSYYMANGFDVGYFGIQVNSPTERWILFSVWDSPTAPTSLVRQGPGVIIDNFGGEGTGGQSHIVYPWKAGQTYRFITRAQADGQGNTLYTAWFGEKCSNKWQLLATWKYAGASKSLTGVYSFLESFNPATGYIGREGNFANEWAVDSAGHWSEITSAYYDVDPTGLNKQRLDFAGGANGKAFYLRNDGFFSRSVASGQTFTRESTGRQPDVDLNKLP
ncbi:DUF3472 domain-containing protein [Dyella sp.]|uniref:DUF3472 domain-containing protein n=1 Tax=Dyella sp. TaxID=1869338 RepID=UPI002ED54CC6